MDKEILKEKYKEHFDDTGLKETTFRAPKTVKLIGDHTEYNNGYVISAAIDREVTGHFQLRDDDKIKLISLDFDQSFETNLDDLEAKNTWNIDILSTVKELIKRDNNIQGFNMIINGDGNYQDDFGYKNALQLITLKGLNFLNNLNLKSKQILSIIEPVFDDLNEKINYYTIQNAKKNHLLLFDSESYEAEKIPFNDDKYQILITGLKNNFDKYKEEYKDSLTNFENIINFFDKEIDEKIETLRDININELFVYENKFNEDEYNKAVHVLTENRRVLDFASSLERDNYQKAGRLIYASYLSVKNEFNIENKKTDFLVKKTNNLDGVLGTKASYGGFGNYTISIIEKEKSSEIVNEVKKIYANKYNEQPNFYLTNTADGISKI